MNKIETLTDHLHARSDAKLTKEIEESQIGLKLTFLRSEMGLEYCKFIKIDQADAIARLEVELTEMRGAK